VQGYVFSSVSKSILLGECDGTFAVLIHGSGRCLHESELITELVQIDSFLTGATETDHFGVASVENDYRRVSRAPANCCIIDKESVTHAGGALGFNVCEAGVSVSIDVTR